MSFVSARPLMRACHHQLVATQPHCHYQGGGVNDVGGADGFAGTPSAHSPAAAECGYLCPQ
jgi:hypothetical protein